jgi:hypothetical protein
LFSVQVDPVSGATSATADKGPWHNVTLAGLRDSAVHTDRLANISTRGRSGINDEVMIAGFVITGTLPRPVLVRAVGPSLADLGVSGVLDDVTLELYRGSTVIATSDNWGSEAGAGAIAATASRLGAFTLSQSSKDAVVLSSLEPGNYTAKVSGVSNATGVALVEVYDAGEGPSSAAAPKLVNISTRGKVGANDDVLIAGIVITGNAPKHLLIRAIGPSLSALGVNGVLSDPSLQLYSGSNVIGENDDWGGSAEISSAAISVGAFPLSGDSKDSCLLVTLMPGNYTAMVRGKGGVTGVALVEVYEVSGR